MVANSVSAGGSSSVLSGVPFSIWSGDWLSTYWEDMLADAIESERQAMVDELRQQASYDPRWAPYADNLDVVFVDGEFHYTVDESVREQVEALEYGSDTVLPTALIMKAARRRGDASAISEQMDRSNPLA